jgi:hypothetical protein
MRITAIYENSSLEQEIWIKFLELYHFFAD